MKKFYLNVIAFLLTLGVIIVGLDILSMHDSCKYLFAKWTDSSDYLVGGPDEIKPFIKKPRLKMKLQSWLLEIVCASKCLINCRITMMISQ